MTPTSWRYLLTDLTNRHALDGLPTPNRIHRIPVESPLLGPLVALDLPSVVAARQWLRALGGTDDSPLDAMLVDYVTTYRGWSVLIHGAGPSAAQVAESILTPDVEPITPSQHCTSDECGYTQSHTAAWCGNEQPRRCDCAFCYPAAAHAVSGGVA